MLSLLIYQYTKLLLHWYGSYGGFIPGITFGRVVQASVSTVYVSYVAMYVLYVTDRSKPGRACSSAVAKFGSNTGAFSKRASCTCTNATSVTRVAAHFPMFDIELLCDGMDRVVHPFIMFEC